LGKVNRQFDSLIMSRLSNPAKGRVVIVAHRLHQNDISGHVLEYGGFAHICLPAIAPRKKRFDMDERVWVRRKGEPLRPDQYTKKVVARLRKSVRVPDFEMLYQQNPQASLSVRLMNDDFILRDCRHMPELPIVLSVDPGAGAFSDRSYSVIQLWLPLSDGNHLLWDEFRERCGFNQLWNAFKHLARRTPSAILIENTASGPALIDRAQGNSRYNVIPVTASRCSKEERLRRHIPLIRKHPIQLRLGGDWVEDYLAEMSEFPCSQFTDQVDATSMYLDFITKNPDLSASARGGFIAGHNRWGRMHPFVPINAAAGVAVSAPSTVFPRRYWA
jgi:predicted phage terminase large subunit-like protein